MTSKNRWVAVYPSGRRFIVRRERGMWTWENGCQSSHLTGARMNIEADGGQLVQEPNPNYRPEPLAHYSATMRRLGL